MEYETPQATIYVILTNIYRIFLREKLFEGSIFLFVPPIYGVMKKHLIGIKRSLPSVSKFYSLGLYWQ